MMLHRAAPQSNNSQIIIKFLRNDIFCNYLLCKKILSGTEVLISYITNREKARVMLQIGAGHRNNSQIILKLFRYYILIAE